MTRLWILFVVALVPLFVAAGPDATSQLNWQVQGVSLPENVRIDVDEATGIETLRLPGGQNVVLEAPAGAAEDVAAFEKLSTEDQETLGSTRRDLMVAVSRLALAGKLSGLSLVQGTQAAHIAPSAESLEEAGLAEIHPIESAAGIAANGTVAKDGRLKKILKGLNEAIFLSTLRAARHHWDARKSMKGFANEFGLQIMLKGELQLGLGKISFTRNFPLLIYLGYRRDTREVMIRVARRTEKMGDGVSISAGLKAEIRHYRKITSSGTSLEIEGVSWYPPAPPMFSMVADSSPTYRSMGLMFGINAADLIPGSYLVNTVNEYRDREIYVKAFTLPELPAWMDRLSATLAGLVKPQSSVLSCAGVYGG